MISAQDLECGDGIPECSLDQINGASITNPPYTGNNGGTFCNGGVIHNAVYFSFIAGNTDMNITVNVDPTLCMLPTNNPPCNDLGVQIAVWDDCSGNCIAGDADCYTSSQSFDVSGMTLGATYHVIMDGCCGTVCSDVTISASPIGGPWDFEIPDLSVVTLDARFAGRCNSSYPPDVFCVGPEIILNAEGIQGSYDLSQLGGLWEWSISGPDPSSVTWEETKFGAGSGTGPTAVYGSADASRNGVGGNQMILTFGVSGDYTICLDNYATFCDQSVSGGPACIDITIADPDVQDFGEYDLCRLFMENDSWTPPPADINGTLFDWQGGAISAFDLDSDGIAELIGGTDDCECPLNQRVKVNLIGANKDNAEVIDIYLYSCQANNETQYVWESEIISDVVSYDNVCGTLFSGSNLTDDRGVTCDSAYVLNVYEIEVGDSIKVLGCGPDGVRVEPVVFRLDGNVFDISSASYSWTIESTGVEVATTRIADLPPNERYCVLVDGLVDDQYTMEQASCIFEYCYFVEGATIADPEFLAYDDEICAADTRGLTFGVQNDPDVTYDWDVPANYSVNGGTSSASINVDIDTYDPSDTLFIIIKSECGDRREPFPIEVAELPQIDIDAPNSGCVGDAFDIEYTGSTSGVDFDWTVTGGTINGSSSGATINVTPDAAGTLSYSLDISNSLGCDDSDNGSIAIDDALPVADVDCAESTSEIVFSWTVDGGASGYDVSQIDVPAGATVMDDADNGTFTVSDLSPGDEVVIVVTTLGSNCGNPRTQQISCFSTNCSPPPFDAGNFMDMSLCVPTEDQTITFTATPPAGYVGEYSGPGITTAGVFDPTDAAVQSGDNTLSYRYSLPDGTCPEQERITITINNDPDPNIDPSNMEICLGEAIDLTLSSNNLTPNWDFGATNDSNGDPDNLVFNTAGPKTISVTVTDPNGCMAESSTNVEVFADFDDIVIQCNTSTDAVTFIWNEISGADEYEIEYTDASGGMTTLSAAIGDERYDATGLAPGETVSITVRAIVSNTPCRAPSASETCSASNCSTPPFTAGNFVDTELCAPTDLSGTLQFDATPPAGYVGEYSGPGVSATGELNLEDPALSVGNNMITYRFALPDGSCAEVENINVRLNQDPDATITPSAMVVCIGTPVTLDLTDNSLNAVWDFGPAGESNGDPNNLIFTTEGPKIISVTLTDDATGCTDESMITIDVVPELDALTLTCAATTSEVTFAWNTIVGADSYELTITDPDGNMTTETRMPGDERYVASGLSQGQTVSLTVRVISTSVCTAPEDSTSCTAQNCDQADIAFTVPRDVFCSNESGSTVNMTVLVNGNDPEPGSGRWEGTGITTIDDMTALFDPDGLGAGIYTIIYTYTAPNGCTDMAEYDMEVKEVPVPNLTASTMTLCVGDELVLMYDELPPTVDAQQWFVDGAQDTNQQSATERYVTWGAAGTYMPSLTYAVPGCQPTTTSVMVEVIDSIGDINIICSETETDYIVWNWEDGNASTQFDIYINDEFQETVTTSEYRRDGLDFGESLTLRVEANNGICASKSDTLTCNAVPCFSPRWDVFVLDSYCYKEGDPGIELDIQVLDPIIGGTVGVPAILDHPNVVGNVLTPTAGSQEYTIKATCASCVCLQDTFITIQIYDNPEFSLSATEQVICEGESTSINFDWTGSGTLDYQWNFAGGSSVSPMDGPQEVTFADAGTYNVTLMIDNNGCASEMQSIDILVEPELVAPTIMCTNSTITSVEFMWDMVDCASMYNVYVDGALATTQSGLTYEVTDLTSEQAVEVYVEALSDCACSDVVSATMSCQSEPCPQVDFDFSRDETEEICLDENAEAFSISATPQGLPGNGTGTWSGDPISDASTGTVDPSLISTAGTYMLTYDYQEGVCNYQVMTSVTFIAPPSVSVVDLTDPACPDDTEGSAMVEGSGGTGPYMYSVDGGSAQASGDLSNLSIGTHSVSVIDANGCMSAAETITISSPSTPTARITGDAIIIDGNDGNYELDFGGTLSPDQIDTIQWTFNGGTVGGNSIAYLYASAQMDGELQATISYNGGCTITTELFSINVKQVQAFYVPNMVSELEDPTSSNNQWTLFIKGDEVFPKSIKIYNRWGNLVHDQTWNFNADNLPDGKLLLWDGTYGSDGTGPDIVSSVYVYKLEIEVEGDTREILGDITIIR